MNQSLKIGNGIIEVKRLISEWWSPSCLCWSLLWGPGWGQRGRGISSTWWSEEPFLFLTLSLSPFWPGMGTWRVKRAPQPCKQKQDFEDRSRRRWWISRRLPVSTRLDLSMPRPGRWWTLQGEKTDKTFRIIKLCDPKVWSERYNWTWGVCTKEEKVKGGKGNNTKSRFQTILWLFDNWFLFPGTFSRDLAGEWPTWPTGWQSTQPQLGWRNLRWRHKSNKENEKNG